jgi:oligoendopeptidase F
MFEFETRLRELAGTGEPLLASQIGAGWLASQRRLYGPAVELTDSYGAWWSYLDSIFLAPGTGYRHAYGQLAASALWTAYVAAPADTAARLISLLAAGGSAAPHVLLGIVGLDTRAADMWQIGTRRLAGDLAQLQAELEVAPRHSATSSSPKQPTLVCERR